MPRHTIETVRDTIATLREQAIVYKVQVDDLKHAFSSAFEADWKAVKDTKYLNKDHEDRTEDETALYFESPMEARHWYGKKFSKFLDELPGSDFKDGAVSHRNRWRPLFLALEELKARQVKGRIPQPKKEVIATRTQLRAICPCCFKQHAVKNDRLVAHGYTLDYGFQNGNCRGVGEKHFGTEEGREVTKTMQADAYQRAVQIRERMDRFSKGEEDIPIHRIDRARGAYITIPNPSDRQKREFIEAQMREAEGLIRYASELGRFVANWTPADAVEVEVEVTE